jgi:outer membrane protein assembly factor BamD
MPSLSFRRGALVALALVAAACHPAFLPKSFQSNEKLYTATMQEFQHKRWDNAIAGFERLTVELPARDTLLPRSHYYLGLAHAKRGENLLAAQSFARVTESFVDDTLADDALFEAAEAYRRMWRKPTLDPSYGQTALSTYRTLLALYPNSPLRDRATSEIALMEQWFATKDYENGMHYFRRKAYDSAIIYFKDIVKAYPNAPRTRDAQLRLVQAYRANRYREDANEVCTQLRTTHPTDREVKEICGSSPVVATPQPQQPTTQTTPPTTSTPPVSTPPASAPPVSAPPVR